MSKKNREDLKKYFLTGETPTAQQFADLIESGLNLAEDDLTIGAEKRLGIGTTAPNARLSVQGSFDLPLSGTIVIEPPAKAGGRPQPPRNLHRSSNEQPAEESAGIGGPGPSPTIVDASATGVGTKFASEVAAGDLVQIGTSVFTVTQIIDDTHMTVQPAPSAAVPASQGFLRGPLLAVKDASGVLRLLVDPSGNVKIGTSMPGANLQIAGAVVASSLQGDGTAISNLDAGQLKTGTIDPARIPSLDESQVPALKTLSQRLDALEQRIRTLEAKS